MKKKRSSPKQDFASCSLEARLVQFMDHFPGKKKRKKNRDALILPNPIKTYIYIYVYNFGLKAEV